MYNIMENNHNIDFEYFKLVIILLYKEDDFYTQIVSFFCLMISVCRGRYC